MPATAMLFIVPEVSAVKECTLKLTIDSDAHVLESPQTWSYMRDFEAPFRPQIVAPIENGVSDDAPRQEFWLIEGRVRSKSGNIAADLDEEARDLTSIERRLAHMDQIGIDVQVLYPTIFLLPLTREHDVEFALVRSYNRWLANIWKQSNNRLRWVATTDKILKTNPGMLFAIA